MTHQPEDPSSEEPSTGSADNERALREDAAWAAIVANYGERPEVSDRPPTTGAGSSADAAGLTRPGDAARQGEPGDPEAPEPDRPPRPGVFDRRYLESQRLEAPSGELNSTAGWHDEGHFVPPPPPPLPIVEPRRRLAWAGLFGAPLMMLLGVVFGRTFPTWFSGLLVAAFVGGFLYLVATMTRVRRDDSSGDNGAVV